MFHPTGTTAKIRFSIQYAELFLFLALAPSVAWGQARRCTPSGEPGRWSIEASELCTNAPRTDPGETRDIRIDAPNHSMAIHIVKDHWSVEIDSEEIRLDSDQSYVTYPAEIAWAPDSRSFYLTQSEGNIEGYLTEIFRIDGKKIEHLSSINETIQRDFDRRHKCTFHDRDQDIGEDPNIVGFHWMSDSSRLIVVVEVPPLSLCNEGGYFGGYLVSIPGGAIIQHYSPKLLRQNWGKLFGIRTKGDFDTLTSKEITRAP